MGVAVTDCVDDSGVALRTPHTACRYLGFMDEVTAFGIVDKDPYDPESAPFDDRNLALPIGFNFPSSCKVRVTWRYMASPGVTWRSWRFVALRGVTWRYMALHDVPWRDLA